MMGGLKKFHKNYLEKQEIKMGVICLPAGKSTAFLHLRILD
jgi:hypothetical protein